MITMTSRSDVRAGSGRRAAVRFYLSHGLLLVCEIYTQKKKLCQYLCFLIKSKILDISLSNCIHELYYRNFTCTFYCVINNASILNP